MEYVAYALIFAGLAIIFVALIFLSRDLKNKSHGTNTKEMGYDERQSLVRGKSFKYGYFSILIYLFVYVVLDAFGLKWCSLSVGVLVGVIVSLLVYAVMVIKNDAYLRIDQNYRQGIFTLIFFGAINIFIGLNNALFDIEKIIKGGQLQFPFVNILFGVAAISLSGYLFCHVKKEAALNATNEENENEEP